MTLLTGPSETIGSPPIKICRKCGVSKPTTEFYKHKNTHDLLRAECKPCWDAAALAYYWANKPALVEKRKDYYFRRKYGLSLEEVKALKTSLCQICRAETGTHIDHDHKSGKVRGVLCPRCNHGLGSFKDNVEYLTNAIQYLEQH